LSRNPAFIATLVPIYRGENMKTASIFFALLSAFLVILAGCPSGNETSNTEKNVNFMVTSGYFVKNTYKGETNPSYLLVRSCPAFDSLFGVAAVMGMDRSKLIDEDKMKSGFILSIIYHGNDVHTFGIDKITLDNSQMKVYYTSTITERNASWTGNFHVTALIQNCEYKSVLLFENGKLLSNAKPKEYD